MTFPSLQKPAVRANSSAHLPPHRWMHRLQLILEAALGQKRE
jgi:hypothetical protein